MLDVTVFTPSDHGSEVAYVIMGGLVYIAAGIAATEVLPKPETQQCFQPPPGGWYPDFDGEALWQAWDGQQWTHHVA